MTAIAIANLEGASALVVDAMVVMATPCAGTRSCAVRDKITAFGDDVYSTLLGDETIRFGLSAVAAWVSVHGERPDFRDRRFIEEGLEAAARSRRAEARHELVDPMDSRLYFIGRGEAFIWRTRYDRATERHRLLTASPTEIERGDAWLDYGGDELEKIEPSAERLIGDMVDIIERTHKARPQHARLPYDFDGRFSSVELPSDRLRKASVQVPFRFATDLFAGNYADWALMEDATFQWSPSWRRRD